MFNTYRVMVVNVIFNNISAISWRSRLIKCIKMYQIANVRLCFLYRNES